MRTPEAFLRTERARLVGPEPRTAIITLTVTVHRSPALNCSIHLQTIRVAEKLLLWPNRRALHRLPSDEIPRVPVANFPLKEKIIQTLL